MVRRRRAAALIVSLLVVLLIIVAVALTTGGGGSGKSAGTSPSAKPKPKPSSTALATPTKKSPLRMFVGGDSMGGELANSVVPILYKTGVVRPTAFYKVSSGLSRPDFYDWLAYWRKYAYRYKAIVFMLGTNDAQNMVGSNGTIFPFPETTWRAEYKRRAGAIMDLMLRNGVQRVYWVCMPIMRSADFSSRMRAINAGFRDAAAARKRVVYVDDWKLFAKSNGDYDPRWRQNDGVHFNFSGVRRLAAYVAGVVEKDWKIKAQAGTSPTS